VDRIYWYVGRYARYLMVMMLVIAAQTLLTFLGPILVRSMLEYAQVGNVQGIKLSFAQFVGAFVALYAFKIAYDFLYVRFSFRLKSTESRNLFDKLLRVRYGFLRKLDPSYFVNRLKETVDHVFKLVGDNVPRAAIALTSILVSLYLVLRIDMWFLLLFVVLLPLSYISYRLLNVKLMEASKDLQRVCAENFKDIVNIVRNVEDIKQLHNYGVFTNLIGTRVDKIERKNNEVFLYARVASELIDFAINLVKNAVLLLSIYLHVTARISFADVMFISLVLAIYFQALSDLNATNLSLRDVRAALAFVSSEVLSQQEDGHGQNVLDEVKHIQLAVERFSYGGDRPVLNEVRLDIVPGDRISIVGQTGCGKTTLVKLLTRLYDADHIAINGIPIREYTLESLRQKVYLVTQDTSLFPGTILDNILIGLDGVGPDGYSDARLAEVCSLPFLEDLVSLPEGLDTQVREGAANLSGGQRQKIAIARMLMHDPDVIIFDESTSALDSKSESELLASIMPFMEGKAIITISHRLSTIRDADRIVVMDGGKIVEVGSFEELVARSARFRDLFAQQIYSDAGE